jgi:phage/plasmid primase-like uncharacterized protein
MKTLNDTYFAGLDALGLDIGSFVPWLGIVSSAAGALTGGDKAAADKKAKEASDAAVKKALEEQAAKAAREKAEASARRMSYILIGVVGVVGLGGVYALARRK